MISVPRRFVVPVLAVSMAYLAPLTALASETADIGAAVVETCASCHALQVDGKSQWGPSLVGLFDRPVGAEVNYRYAPYLRGQNAVGAVWDEDSLRDWLKDSKGIARAAGGRTKMPSQRLTDDQIDDVILFLRGLE